MEECVEAGCPCRRVGRTDRNHFDLEVLNTAGVPCLAHGVTLEETKQSKTLYPADVKPCRAHRRPARARQQHVSTQRLVAALGYTTAGEKSFAGANLTCSSYSPVNSDVRSFFSRARPTGAQSCDGARRSHARRSPSRQSRARSSAAAHAPQCVPTAPPRR